MTPMEMPKTYENGSHKYEVFNIKANLKIDTIENADFHGVKIEDAPYIEKRRDCVRLCKPNRSIFWCQILTFLKY